MAVARREQEVLSIVARLQAAVAGSLLLAALALSGCAWESDLYSSSYADPYYHGGYSPYRQAQWTRFYHDREQMLENERLAVQSERLQLERERLAWEQQQLERLRDEQALRAQWELGRPRHEQPRLSQPDRDPLYRAEPRWDQQRQDEQRRDDLQRQAQHRREELQRRDEKRQEEQNRKSQRNQGRRNRR